LAQGFIFQFSKIENLANCVKETVNLVEIAFKNKLVQKNCFERIAKLQKNSPKRTINEHLYLLALPIGKRCIRDYTSVQDLDLGIKIWVTHWPMWR
jgi:hypothetical protein